MKVLGKRLGADRRSSGGHGSSRVAEIGIVAALSVVLLGACGHLMTMLHGNVKPPAESEFGLGPRVSSDGLYQATLEPAEPLRTRKLQTARLVVRMAEGASIAEGMIAGMPLVGAPLEDAPVAGAPVNGATITVAGGMPQHGHGLPTTPRVTRAPGEGAYRVEGLKFNMGGWWEVKFRIEAAAGVDSVTFNLAL